MRVLDSREGSCTESRQPRARPLYAMRAGGHRFNSYLAFLTLTISVSLGSCSIARFKSRTPARRTTGLKDHVWPSSDPKCIG